MQRTYAEIGDEFILRNTDGLPRKFIITGIKGEGGSSLVYSAETDSGMKSVIKEFFPILARDYSFTRTGGVLHIDKIVTISEEFLSREQRFVHSVAIMNRLAFSEETAEETLAAELLSNSDGIPYIVTEWNPQRVVCYEDVKTSSLNEIAVICLRLTEIISEYHNMGYIHLDIKPANILWSKKYNYIKLFDFDAVSLEAEQPELRSTAVTQSYAAPEAEAHDSVNAKADLYSIGAILFERVMERKLNPMLGDRVNFRYERELSNKPLMLNESEEAVALTKTILHGTICAAPGKRMSSEKLVELLKNLSEITAPQNTDIIKPEKYEFPNRLRNTLFAVCGFILCASVILPVIFLRQSLPGNTIDHSISGGNFQTKDLDGILSHTIEAGREILSNNTSVNSYEAYDLFSDEDKASEESLQYFVPVPDVSKPAANDTPPASQSALVTVNTSVPYTSGTTVTSVTSITHENSHSTSSFSTQKTPAETLPAATAQTPAITPDETHPATTAQTPGVTPEEIPVNNSDEFLYASFEEGVELTYYIGKGGDVVIPQNIDGLPVIKLGNRLFEDRDDITSVIMPDGLRIIDYSTFWGCSGLSDIVIPESVEVINSNAFYGASGIHSIYIPENVAEIGNLCFGWTSIDKIEVSPKNNNYSSVNGVLYNKGGDIMLCYPCYKPDKEFSVPEEVIEIYSFAFDRPKYLEKLHIGKNLCKIDDCQVFEYVNEITVDMDNSYFTAYEGSLFNKNLTKMWFYPPNSEKKIWKMPESVKTLGFYCFTEIKHLKRLEISVMLEALVQGAIQESFNYEVVFNDEIYTPQEFYELYLSGAY